MSGTISDWIISLRSKGFKDTAEAFHTEKSIDDKRLISSGLPTFARMQVPYNSFIGENQEVAKFLSRYDLFIVRALPIKGRSDLPRRPKIGVRSFEECFDFLSDLFSEGGELEGKEEFYNISLVEKELTRGSGIIISNSQKVYVEVGECSLDNLSHGANPNISCLIDLAGLGHITDKTHWNVGESRQNERFVRDVLRYIELSRDSFNPLFMRGYFEFVITKENRIKFWDYKTNEMYLK